VLVLFLLVCLFVCLLVCLFVCLLVCFILHYYYFLSTTRHGIQVLLLIVLIVKSIFINSDFVRV
jgi:hypothetical protein